MADTYTDNFNYTLPEFDASDDTWDEKLNANFEQIDADLNQATSWTHKTAAYTAVARDRVLADTSGGAWTLTLPSAPETGDTIEVQDATGSWLAENLTVDGNGNDIDGSATFTGNVDGDRFTLTYNGIEWARRGSAVVRLPLEFVSKVEIPSSVTAVDIELPEGAESVLILARYLNHSGGRSAPISARTSSDGGATFDSGATSYATGTSGSDSLDLGRLSNNYAEIQVMGASNAAAYTVVTSLRADNIATGVVGGYRQADEVNTHLRLFTTGGVFIGGEFLVYKYADLG